MCTFRLNSSTASVRLLCLRFAWLIAATKSKEPKELSEQQSLWQDFRKKRTEELKQADPDQDGRERQRQIADEWKKSPENPKHE
ncbi:hypothetical protein Rt10032_c05g2404 [Rhodotorula toruloides]|uniref:Uncharacterized protein n=1 Tax=Rhodotorula toruloides TaxID=5286 RepID=A0A511KDD7_RHOTO|nr:hypothetical protein Rt10032_c05g2404 [Rhodotorula toruloides]